jgi:hypothetical protein
MILIQPGQPQLLDSFKVYSKGKTKMGTTMTIRLETT